MNIALVGYGKMGHMLKAMAEKQGQNICLTVDPLSPDADVKIASGDKSALAKAITDANPDGIIEFSHPSAVMENINTLLPLGIPMVVGTTGWHDKLMEVETLAKETSGTLMYSSNFSIGVNMFYKIVEEAVKIMNPYSEYDTAIWEMHHNQKADSPSGTALEIARRIMENNPLKTKIVKDAFSEKPEPSELHVSSTRCGSVPGTHTVFFDSNADTIEITHRTRNREGLATGAVYAIVNLVNAINTNKLQRGKVYGMKDLF